MVTKNILEKIRLKQGRNICLAMSAALHLGLAAWLMWPSSSEIIVPQQQIVAIELVAMQASIPSKQPEAKTQIVQPKAKNPEIALKKQPDKASSKNETRENNAASSASGDTVSNSDRTQNASSTEPVFNAAYLNNPPPVYPAVARRQNIEGQVLLEVVVSANGQADAVEIKNSSGSPLLDNAAMDAVRRWRFVPAKQNDIAVAANVMVPVVFKIQG